MGDSDQTISKKQQRDEFYLYYSPEIVQDEFDLLVNIPKYDSVFTTDFYPDFNENPYVVDWEKRYPLDSYLQSQCREDQAGQCIPFKQNQGKPLVAARPDEFLYADEEHLGQTTSQYILYKDSFLKGIYKKRNEAFEFDGVLSQSVQSQSPEFFLNMALGFAKDEPSSLVEPFQSQLKEATIQSLSLWMKDLIDIGSAMVSAIQSNLKDYAFPEFSGFKSANDVLSLITPTQLMADLGLNAVQRKYYELALYIYLDYFIKHNIKTNPQGEFDSSRFKNALNRIESQRPSNDLIKQSISESRALLQLVSGEVFESKDIDHLFNETIFQLSHTELELISSDSQNGAVKQKIDRYLALIRAPLSVAAIKEADALYAEIVARIDKNEIPKLEKKIKTSIESIGSATNYLAFYDPDKIDQYTVLSKAAQSVSSVTTGVMQCYSTDYVSGVINISNGLVGIFHARKLSKKKGDATFTETLIQNMLQISRQLAELEKGFDTLESNEQKRLEEILTLTKQMRTMLIEDYTRLDSKLDEMIARIMGIRDQVSTMSFRLQDQAQSEWQRDMGRCFSNFSEGAFYDSLPYSLQESKYIECQERVFDFTITAPNQYAELEQYRDQTLDEALLLSQGNNSHAYLPKFIRATPGFDEAAVFKNSLNGQEYSINPLYYAQTLEQAVQMEQQYQAHHDQSPDKIFEASNQKIEGMLQGFETYFKTLQTDSSYFEKLVLDYKQALQAVFDEMEQRRAQLRRYAALYYYFAYRDHKDFGYSSYKIDDDIYSLFLNPNVQGNSSSARFYVGSKVNESQWPDNPTFELSRGNAFNDYGVLLPGNSYLASDTLYQLPSDFESQITRKYLDKPFDGFSEDRKKDLLRHVNGFVTQDEAYFNFEVDDDLLAEFSDVFWPYYQQSWRQGVTDQYHPGDYFFDLSQKLDRLNVSFLKLREYSRYAFNVSFYGDEVFSGFLSGNFQLWDADHFYLMSREQKTKFQGGSAYGEQQRTEGIMLVSNEDGQLPDILPYHASSWKDASKASGGPRLQVEELNEQLTDHLAFNFDYRQILALRRVEQFDRILKHKIQAIKDGYIEEPYIPLEKSTQVYQNYKAGL